MARCEMRLVLQVNYDEKKNARNGHDSEYSGDSDADDDSAAEEDSPGKPAAKVSKPGLIVTLCTLHDRKHHHLEHGAYSSQAHADGSTSITHHCSAFVSDAKQSCN